MSKSKITVNILGQEHSIISTDNPKYVKEIAKMVDDRMTTIFRANSSLSPNKIGVLAALNLADELTKTRKKVEELKVSEVSPKIEIKEAKKQIIDMTKKIEDAEELYVVILDELEMLKSTRKEQEKFIRDMTSNLNNVCEDLSSGDQKLIDATRHIKELEKKLLTRENEIAEYAKVFDEMEKNELEKYSEGENIVYDDINFEE